MKRLHTHYDNLKVARDAPVEVIQAAYRSLAMKYHPDRNKDNPDAERVMKVVNQAYEVLSDLNMRKQHDAWIREQEQAEEPTQSQETRREWGANQSHATGGKQTVKGWVYIITNPAMPGLVKVGYSLKDPILRAQELDGTHSPFPHQVAYWMLVDEPRNVEQRVHKLLEPVQAGKEWFRCSIEHAVIQIQAAAEGAAYVENFIYANEQRVKEEIARKERERQEAERKRREEAERKQKEEAETRERAAREALVRGRIAKEYQACCAEIEDKYEEFEVATEAEAVFSKGMIRLQGEIFLNLFGIVFICTFVLLILQAVIIEPLFSNKWYSWIVSLILILIFCFIKFRSELFFHRDIAPNGKSNNQCDRILLAALIAVFANFFVGFMFSYSFFNVVIVFIALLVVPSLTMTACIRRGYNGIGTSSVEIQIKVFGLAKDISRLGRKAKELRKEHAQIEAQALYRTGFRYYYDNDTKDYDKALESFRAASELGLADAQYCLGRMLFYGHGVFQSYTEARKWWLKAALQGKSDAMFGMGQLANKGLGGPQDNFQALVWFNRASEQGSKESVKARESLLKTMTPEQIARAQEMSSMLGA